MTETPVDRLVLIPGLGTDARLFAPQKAGFPQLEIPAWIDPRRHEPLAEYACRLAATVDGSRPLVIGGVSIGGMLALEMARHLPATRVVLIASCTHPRAVNPWLRASERIARPWPAWMMHRLTVFAPLFVGQGGTVPRESRRLLVRMAREIPIDFIRWGARAVLEWPGVPDPGVPVMHIHGGRDRVLSPRRVSPTEVIPDGSHVLNLSHHGEVNRFLAAALRG